MAFKIMDNSILNDNVLVGPSTQLMNSCQEKFPTVQYTNSNYNDKIFAKYNSSGVSIKDCLGKTHNNMKWGALADNHYLVSGSPVFADPMSCPYKYDYLTSPNVDWYDYIDTIMCNFGFEFDQDGITEDYLMGNSTVGQSYSLSWDETNKRLQLELPADWLGMNVPYAERFVYSPSPMVYFEVAMFGGKGGDAANSTYSNFGRVVAGGGGGGSGCCAAFLIDVSKLKYKSFDINWYYDGLLTLSFDNKNSVYFYSGEDGDNASCSMPDATATNTKVNGNKVTGSSLASTIGAKGGAGGEYTFTYSWEYGTNFPDGVCPLWLIKGKSGGNGGYAVYLGSAESERHYSNGITSSAVSAVSVSGPFTVNVTSKTAPTTNTTSTRANMDMQNYIYLAAGGGGGGTSPHSSSKNITGSQNCEYLYGEGEPGVYRYVRGSGISVDNDSVINMYNGSYDSSYRQRLGKLSLIIGSDYYL